LNILCLQAFNLAPKNGSRAFGNPHFDRCRHLLDKKILVSFTRKSAVPHEIKSKILDLSIRRRLSKLSAAFIFVSCEEKDYCCIISVAQLGLTAARIVSTAGFGQFVGVRLPSMFPSASPRGTLRVWGKQN